ncbi:MAG: hypothetical protein AAGI17_07650 [Planctomycetota bacterium]
MKSLGRIITVVSVANVLALGSFVGWLLMTQRLNGDRLTEVRELLAEPAPIVEARAKQAEREARRAAEAAEPEIPDGAPVGSSQVLALRTEASEADLERIARMRRETDDLRRTLLLERRLLDEEREKFERERAEYQQMRATVAEAEGAANFKKSLSVLEQIKAADAKSILSELIATGDTQQVVIYLNAMQARPRAQIMREFVKDEESPLAAELLEALRLQGLETLESGGADGDPSIAANPGG